jgi:hypothetical protein
MTAKDRKKIAQLNRRLVALQSQLRVAISIGSKLEEERAAREEKAARIGNLLLGVAGPYRKAKPVTAARKKNLQAAYIKQQQAIKQLNEKERKNDERLLDLEERIETLKDNIRRVKAGKKLGDEAENPMRSKKKNPRYLVTAKQKVTKDVDLGILEDKTAKAALSRAKGIYSGKGYTGIKAKKKNPPLRPTTEKERERLNDFFDAMRDYPARPGKPQIDETRKLINKGLKAKVSPMELKAIFGKHVGIKVATKLVNEQVTAGKHRETLFVRPKKANGKAKAALKTTGRAIKGATRGILSAGSQILGAGARALNPKTGSKGIKPGDTVKDNYGKTHQVWKIAGTTVYTYTPTHPTLHITKVWPVKKAKNAYRIPPEAISKFPAHMQAEYWAHWGDLEKKEEKAATPKQKAAVKKAKRSFLSRVAVKVRALSQSRKYKVRARHLAKAPIKIIKVRSTSEDGAIAQAKSKLGSGFDQFKIQNVTKPRKGNPTYTIMARKKNLEAGFWSGGVFHPIRSSRDYDPDRAGDTTGKSRQSRSKAAKATRAKARSTSTTRERVASRKATTSRLAGRSLKKSAGMLKRKNSRFGPSYRPGKEAKQERIKEYAFWINRWKERGEPITTLPKSFRDDLKEAGEPTRQFAGEWKAARALAARERRATPKKKRGIISRLFGRNPSPASIRKSFAGRLGKGAELYFPDGTPQGLAKLGKLVSITTEEGTIKPVHGTAWLCSDTRGKLHIGSTSNNPIFAGPSRNFGKVSKIEYEESKPHLGYKNPVIWFHKLGEETGEKPTLHADGKGGLKFKGGAYKIESRGIVN